MAELSHSIFKGGGLNTELNKGGKPNKGGEGNKRGKPAEGRRKGFSNDCKVTADEIELDCFCVWCIGEEGSRGRYTKEGDGETTTTATTPCQVGC